MSVDEALAAISSNYRLYTVDASVEGRFSVMLILTGKERDNWFLAHMVRDLTSKEVRPDLYVVGTADTLAGAITKAAALADRAVDGEIKP